MRAQNICSVEEESWGSDSLNESMELPTVSVQKVPAYFPPVNKQTSTLGGNHTDPQPPRNQSKRSYLCLKLKDFLVFLTRYEADLVVVCPYDGEPLPHTEISIGPGIFVKMELSVQLAEALLKESLKTAK